MGWWVPAICLLATTATAGVVVRPQGAVSLLEDGREVRRVRSAFPLSDHQMVLCRGQCWVQMSGVQFTALDQSVFGVAEGTEGWDVMVSSGRLDFAMRSDAKPVNFRTPHDVLQVEEVVVPASSQGVVRGTLTVTEAETRLTVQQGTLRVSAGGGSHVIAAGYELQLAQAHMAPPAAGKNEEDDSDNKTILVPGAAGGSGSGGAASGGAAGGVAGGGSAAGGAVAGGGAAGAGAGAGIGAGLGAGLGLTGTTLVVTGVTTALVVGGAVAASEGGGGGGGAAGPEEVPPVPPEEVSPSTPAGLQ
jgi:hypothetical protein